MTERYRSSVERAIQRCFAVLALMLALLWTSTLSVLASRLSVGMLLIGTVFVIVLLMELARAWRCRLGLVDVWLALIAAAAVGVVIAVSRAHSLEIGIRCPPAVVAVLLSAGLLRRPPAGLVCLGVCFGQWMGSLPLDRPLIALEGVWPVAASAVAAGFVTQLLRSAAGNADSAYEALSAAKAEEARTRGLRAAHREFQRMLHDDVSAALRSVAGPGVTRAEARVACAEAVAAAARASRVPDRGVRDLAQDIETLGSHIPGVTMTARGNTRVPASVATAFLAAAGEGLRNAQRHAFAASIRVELTGDEHTVRLDVVDDGVGFSPSGTTSWGLRQSVTARLEEIGGTAQVASRRGAGTTVRLAWPRPAATVPGPTGRPGKATLIALAVGDVRKPLAAVGIPFQLIMNGLAVQYGDGSHDGWDWLTSWYTLVTVAVLVLILRANRALPGWASFGVALLALLGQVPGLLSMKAESLSSFESWPIGALTPLYVVLLVLRPEWEALLLLAVDEIIVLLSLLVGGLTNATAIQALPAMLSPAFGSVMTLMLVLTTVRLGAVVANANTSQMTLTIATSEREARLAMHEQRRAEIGRVVVPFLTTIATTQENCPWDELRCRAAVLETMARDELHLPGIIDTGLRERFAAARTSGCVITLQSDADAAPPPPMLGDLLTAALSGGSPPRQLTLSLYPDGNQIEVSLVTVPGDQERAQRINRYLQTFGATLEDSPEATSATFTLPAN
jgi:hypothetical protein